MPSHTPFGKPYCWIASYVYCEHDGWNRHTPRKSTGDSVIWYSVIAPNAALRIATPFDLVLAPFGETALRCPVSRFTQYTGAPEQIVN